MFAQAQTFTVLHNFTGGQDGKTPNTGLTMDRAGNLYGTTSYGGYQSNSDCKDLGGCGVVFKLARGGSGWIFPRCTCSKEFSTTATDPYPDSPVIFGSNGALYGTTTHGGLGDGCNDGCGTVFQLTPPAKRLQGLPLLLERDADHSFR